MRLLKILCLVLLFITVSSLSHAGARARRKESVRPANTSRPSTTQPSGPARAVPVGLASDLEAPPAKSLPSRDSLINSAYLDASGILAGENACSRFFGGSYAALTVLTRLAGQLRPTKLDPGVGIRMYGPTTDFSDPPHALRYRLFEKAVVNMAGPFGARQSFSNEPPVRRVGSFEPDTREARVLMLLHELGHLITGPDSGWLLPNDGGDDARSVDNTRLVESKCGEQIRALRNR